MAGAPPGGVLTWAADLTLGLGALSGACGGLNPHQAVLLDAVDRPPTPGWTDEGRLRPAEGGAPRAPAGRRLQQVREGRGRSITGQVERAILIMGTLDDVIADPLSMGGRAALDRIKDRRDRGYEETPGASLRSFLFIWIWRISAKGRTRCAALGRRIPRPCRSLTIHGSKGLELGRRRRHGMSDGVFPSHRIRRSWRDEPLKSTAWVTDNGAFLPVARDKADLTPFEFDVEGEKAVDRV